MSADDVDVCADVCANARAWVSMWGSEVNAKCLPQLLSVLGALVTSLNLELIYSARLAEGPTGPRVLLPPFLQHWDSGSGPPCPTFVWVLGI